MREQLLQKEKQCAQMSIDQQVLEHAKLVAERDKLQAGRCTLASLSFSPTRQRCTDAHADSMICGYVTEQRKSVASLIDRLANCN